jgi:biopolymer transport protein ExbB/TolQ
VPCLIAHRYLKSHVDALLLRLEQSARRLRDSLRD